MKTTTEYYSGLSLLRQKIDEAQYQQQYFFSWYRHSFRGYKFNSLSIWHLDIWSFKDEGLGIYPTWTKYLFFLPTLDGPASILRP